MYLEPEIGFDCSGAINGMDFVEFKHPRLHMRIFRPPLLQPPSRCFRRFEDQFVSLPLFYADAIRIRLCLRPCSRLPSRKPRVQYGTPITIVFLQGVSKLMERVVNLNARLIVFPRRHSLGELKGSNRDDTI